MTSTTGQEQQGTLELQQEKKSAGPVECLGLTFENEQARREHFLALLKEKLQDPEFRKTPGFPQGSDEAILRMSDPPYYTACPNPFFLEVAHGLDHSDEFQNQPFAIDVSEGKTGAFYNAHTYHTKVPPTAIAKYLLWFTKPGDVVLDCFGGSGMTGVAARLCATNDTSQRQIINKYWEEMGLEKPEWGARTALVNDISPAATFISSVQATPVDKERLKDEIDKALGLVQEELAWLYQTAHNGWHSGERNPRKWVNRSPVNEETGEIIATLWSEVFRCPQCGAEIVLWDDGVDADQADIQERITCSSCSFKSTKNELERCSETYWDELLERTVTRNKFVPSLIIYDYKGRRFEKRPDSGDLAVIEKTRSASVAEGPVRKMMDSDGAWGGMHRAGYHCGITHLHHFYTERNWIALSRLWNELSSSSARFVLTSLMPRLSKMHALHLKNFFKGGGGFAAGNRKGQLYIPSLSLELSPFAYLSGRASSAIQGLPDANEERRALVSTGSAEALPLPPNSVDYVFIDPPFGQNIIYSELNFLWEAWLGVITNNKREAIVDDFRNKSLSDYQAMMSASFSEVARVLKPGRWVTIVFHNSKNSVWRAIQESLQKAGLIVGDVRVLDKRQSSQKQAVAPGTVKSDLAITAYKPSHSESPSQSLEAGSSDALWSFIRDHLAHAAVFDIDTKRASVLPERQAHILFDRAVAYHVHNGLGFPLNASEFYEGLRTRFPERDGMYFLPDQVTEYDRKRTTATQLRQLSIFVNDEHSAIQWIRQQLQDKPQSFQDLQPQFMREQAWAKHERTVELKVILEQNFLHYDGRGPVPSQIHSYPSTNFKDLRNLEKEDSKLSEKARDRWYVPDPNKQAERDQIRERALLKEFEEIKESTQRRIKQFRTEAVRAGFKACWQEKDYATIVKVAAKLPEAVLQEDEKLLMYIDNAQTRLGDDA